MFVGSTQQTWKYDAKIQKAILAKRSLLANWAQPWNWVTPVYVSSVQFRVRDHTRSDPLSCHQTANWQFLPLPVRRGGCGPVPRKYRRPTNKTCVIDIGLCCCWKPQLLFDFLWKHCLYFTFFFCFLAFWDLLWLPRYITFRKIQTRSSVCADSCFTFAVRCEITIDTLRRCFTLIKSQKIFKNKIKIWISFKGDQKNEISIIPVQKGETKWNFQFVLLISSNDVILCLGCITWACTV